MAPTAQSPTVRKKRRIAALRYVARRRSVEAKSRLSPYPGGDKESGERIGGKGTKGGKKNSNLRVQKNRNQKTKKQRTKAKNKSKEQKQRTKAKNKSKEPMHPTS
jgi:hypothetical protein